MEAKVKGATRRDVEMKAHEVELAKVRAKADLLRHIGQGIRWALFVCSFALPIWAMQKLVEPLSGKTTNVHLGVAVSIVATISVGGNFFQWLKGRERRRTIERQRALLTDFERLQGGSE
jgi:hypothetical protein